MCARSNFVIVIIIYKAVVEDLVEGLLIEAQEGTVQDLVENKIRKFIPDGLRLRRILSRAAASCEQRGLLPQVFIHIFYNIYAHQ